ncbi:hypothetical protein QUC31_017227 [Theobroma cacao]|uniref:DNA N(6)-methyladenine demethylase n=2 Tax=Theobroma cacao TaxID=3641 RepID=A0A061EHN0_THECC|nr:2-oxoglutarate-dependent dioxygenase family protein isoform 1 [Theobroma cacao]
MLSVRRMVQTELCPLSTVASVSRQIAFTFCSLKMMNPAKETISSRAGCSSITADKPFGNESSGVKQGRSSQLSQQMLGGGAVEFSGALSLNDKQFQSGDENEFPPLTLKGRNSNNRRTRSDSGFEPRHKAVDSSEHKGIANSLSLQDKCSLPSHFGKKVVNIYVPKSVSGESKSKDVVGTKNTDFSEGLPKVERFDICLPTRRAFGIQKVLRPGMVLLKRYISLCEQINIVKTCQTLGVGPGGFYRPGYKDGAKLRLHMMCLGLNWDPQTRKYDKRHPIDDCEPPNIPCEFCLLVRRAIQDAHCLIKKNYIVGNVEDVLPSMSPDICIINFYTTNGRLGLHQDRDESRESLHKGLPVVSFSIGNSAEFLYGDQRDEDKAEKVVLDSGDVLIFGGESRMVFHGVPSIIPNTAPQALLAETGLRRGRLNLTFRQL